MNWWLPHNFEQKKQNLKVRQKVIKAIRTFFDEQDFWEVETSALQVMPGGEVHVHAFQTERLSPDLKNKETFFLHTSPELAMKKLLVAGVERLYQICPVYRNAEGSSLHSCEFKMLEWYRAGADYQLIMEDTISLLRAVAKAAGTDKFRHKNFEADPFLEWEKITVAEAFEKYAGVDLSLQGEDTQPCFPEKESLGKVGEGGRSKNTHAPSPRKSMPSSAPQEDFLSSPCRGRIAGQASEIGVRVEENDTFDDIFFRIFMERIEPHLGQEAPTILYDYPAHMAALSKVKESDPRVAERFEVYVCGIELANAFTELIDAKIQKARFEVDMDQKRRIYGSSWPVDTDFIAALEHGMPAAGGIALGVDRLCMLACGAEDIKDILFAT